MVRRAWAWVSANPEAAVAILVPLLGTLFNALDGAIRVRFPRVAGVMGALFPHVRHALEVLILRRQLGTSLPPPAASLAPPAPSVPPEVKP